MKEGSNVRSSGPHSPLTGVKESPAEKQMEKGMDNLPPGPHDDRPTDSKERPNSKNQH